MMETSQIETALDHRMIVCQTEAGENWSGTMSWFVKDRSNRAAPLPASVTRVVTATYEHTLEPMLHRGGALYEKGANGFLRLFTRPDGKPVRLNDAYLAAIDSMLEEEDEDGYEVHHDFVFRQDADRFGMVGVFVADELVAVVAPVRKINEHLADD